MRLGMAVLLIGAAAGETMAVRPFGTGFIFLDRLATLPDVGFGVSRAIGSSDGRFGVAAKTRVGTVRGGVS